jgi:pyroglutamyl-peptidase
VSADLLLLAFGPFGPWAENSTDVVSAAAANRLREHGVVVDRRVLPTSLAAVRSLVMQVLEEPPKAVLACGLSAESPSVQIERCARNLADFRIPDVAGLQPSGELLIEGAPEKLYGPLADESLLRSLRGASVPAVLSDDAGTYICNALYFSLLDGLAPSGAAALFMHLPPLPGLLRADGAEPSVSFLPMEQQVTAVVAVADALLSATVQ